MAARRWQAKLGWQNDSKWSQDEWSQDEWGYTAPWEPEPAATSDQDQFYLIDELRKNVAKLSTAVTEVQKELVKSAAATAQAEACAAVATAAQAKAVKDHHHELREFAAVIQTLRTDLQDTDKAAEQVEAEVRTLKATVLHVQTFLLGFTDSPNSGITDPVSVGAASDGTVQLQSGTSLNSANSEACCFIHSLAHPNLLNDAATAEAAPAALAAAPAENDIAIQGVSTTQGVTIVVSGTERVDHLRIPPTAGRFPPAPAAAPPPQQPQPGYMIDPLIATDYGHVPRKPMAATGRASQHESVAALVPFQLPQQPQQHWHQLQLVLLLDQPRQPTLFVQQRQHKPCMRCRDPHNPALTQRCVNSSVVRWKWGQVVSTFEQVYQGQIRLMDMAGIEPMQQAMKDSPLFDVCAGNAKDRIMEEMRKGIETSSLVCGWHRTKAYTTIILHCPCCKWMAAAEIYTTPYANGGVTQEDYYKVQQLLCEMLGVELGPHQGV